MSCSHKAGSSPRSSSSSWTLQLGVLPIALPWEAAKSFDPSICTFPIAADFRDAPWETRRENWLGVSGEAPHSFWETRLGKPSLGWKRYPGCRSAWVSGTSGLMFVRTNGWATKTGTWRLIPTHAAQSHQLPSTHGAKVPYALRDTEPPCGTAW